MAQMPYVVYFVTFATYYMKSSITELRSGLEFKYNVAVFDMTRSTAEENKQLGFLKPSGIILFVYST